MKLKFLIIIVTLAFSSTLFAQLTLGAKAGVTYSDLMISNYQDPNIKSIKAQNGASAQLGFFVRARILDFYIQPELLYTNLAGNIEAKSINYQTQSYNFSLNRLEIPIPVGVRLGKFSLIAGPVAQFNLNSGNSIFYPNFKYGSWSLLGGVGFKQKDFYIDIRYQRGLDSFASKAEFDFNEEIYRVNMEFNVSMFVLSAGYIF